MQRMVFFFLVAKTDATPQNAVFVTSYDDEGGRRCPDDGSETPVLTLKKAIWRFFGENGPFCSINAGPVRRDERKSGIVTS